MRLVMVAHSFPRRAGDVPGSFLLRLGEALVQRGHTITVVTPSDRGEARRFSLGGLDVVQVRYASPQRENLAYTGDMSAAAASVSGAWAFLSLVRALRAAARGEASRINADVVHAFWWVPGGWAITGASLPPTVITLMGTDVATMKSVPARMLARRVLGGAAQVTALTTFLAAETRRLLGTNLDIAVVPVPVDVGRFSGAPESTGAGIVYLGRLTRQKRVHLLFDAIQTAGLKVPVTVVGDGPARAELEAQVRSLRLENVTFLGVVPDAEVPRLVREAAVTAFLGEREGQGLAAAEAQMLGTPVVATSDGGGVLDLLRDGEGSFLVSPTPAAVGAALARCLSEPAVRLAAVGAGARLRQELSPDSIAQRFEQIYARII